MVREPGLKTPHDLPGQGNFRHQYHHLLPGPDGPVGQPQVDFRLAAAGDAFQKKGLGLLFRSGPVHRFHRSLLLRSQLQIFPGCLQMLVAVPQHPALPFLQIAQKHQSVDYIVGDALGLQFVAGQHGLFR